MKIISVVGYKSSGKTTLVEKLVRELKKYGSVGTVKHLHEHSINTVGTDTWKHAYAGADVVVGVTQNELVKFSRNNTLNDALDELANSGMDFGIVEGFKNSTLPKIALGNIDVQNIIKRGDVKVEEILDSFLEYHTLNSLIHKLKKGKDIDKAGAIGTFTGIVRKNTDGIQTEFLEFESYNTLAKQKMDEICNELKKRDGIIDVLMYHKIGIIAPSQDIVYIVVSAGHRNELFPVLKEAIERLKSDVPIWKKEHTLKGEWWVHDE